MHDVVSFEPDAPGLAKAGPASIRPQLGRPQPGRPQPARPTPGHAATAPAAGFAEPEVARIRGPKLVLIWLALALGAWVVVGGAAYGAWTLAAALVG